MNRRDLLQSLFVAPLATCLKPTARGLFDGDDGHRGLDAIRSASRATEYATVDLVASHYYNWKSGFTTDPACTPLQYGAASPRIFLNGKELPLETPITRCVSGENGFVECFDEAEFKRALAIDPFVVFNADGTKNPHPLDELPLITLRGRVEVVPR